MKAIVLFMLFAFGSLSAIAQLGTVYDQMRKLQSIHHVHFIYESELNLKIPYRTSPKVSCDRGIQMIP